MSLVLNCPLDRGVYDWPFGKTGKRIVVRSDERTGQHYVLGYCRLCAVVSVVLYEKLGRTGKFVIAPPKDGIADRSDQNLFC